MHECHVVCGPPAAGKTTEARRLAAEIRACLLDSDQVADRLIRAGLELAGLDPEDRDSPAYKRAYRDAVYGTLLDLAAANLNQVPVVIAGPFTAEGGDPGWPDRLEARLGGRPVLHYVDCDPDERRLRMQRRGEARDRAKLAAWDTYLAGRREARPVWPHRFVDTGPGASSNS